MKINTEEERKCRKIVQL